MQQKQKSAAVESALNSTSNNFCFHRISDHTRKKPQRQSHANSGEVKFRAASIAILALFLTLRQQKMQRNIAIVSALTLNLKQIWLPFLSVIFNVAKQTKKGRNQISPKLDLK